MCNACAVRGEDCVYPSPRGAWDQRRRQRSVSRGPSPEASHNDRRSVPFRPLNFNVSAAEKPQNVGSGLNMSDLNLLQHFIQHTSKSMTLHKIKTVVWERVIPDLAAANEFLMHLILALAGANILITGVSSTPWNPSLHLIMEHHQQGLAGLQKALCATSEPNEESLLAGSMLVVGFAFASLGIKDLDPSIETASQDPTTHSRSLIPLQIQWFHLVRGVTSILGQFWSILRRCRLRSLLFFNNANDDWKLCESELRSGVVAVNQNIKSKRLRRFASGANRALSDLREICAALRDSEPLEEGSDDSPLNDTPRSERSGKTSANACEQAIDVVEDLYMRILYILQMKPLDSQSPTTDLEIQTDLEDAAISAWPHNLPEDFVSILDSSQHHGNVDALLLGVSLTILAHLYSTIAVLEGVWYLGKTCDAEIRKINCLVRELGDERLVRVMEWPVDVIEQ